MYEEMNEEIEKFEAQEKAKWFNPKVGTFEVKILSEMSEPYEQEFEDQKTGKTKNLIKYNLRILVDGEEMLWSFSKGNTKASVFGMLVDIAVRNKQKLTGVVLSVGVKSDGKKRDFFIDAKSVPKKEVKEEKKN